MAEICPHTFYIYGHGLESNVLDWQFNKRTEDQDVLKLMLKSTTVKHIPDFVT